MSNGRAPNDDNIMLEACQDLFNRPDWYEGGSEALPEHTDTASFVLDVRGFQDPNAGSLREHWGTHVGILQGISGNRPVLASLLRKFIMTARTVHAQMPGQLYRVFVLCRGGKHRSVAFAYLLERLLLIDDRHTVLHTIHLRDPKKCTRCKYCILCNRDFRNRGRAEALNQALPVWMELGGDDLFPDTPAAARA